MAIIPPKSAAPSTPEGPVEPISPEAGSTVIIENVSCAYVPKETDEHSSTK